MQKIQHPIALIIVSVVIFAIALGLTNESLSHLDPQLGQKSDQKNINIVNLGPPNPQQGLIADPSTNQIYIPPRNPIGRAPKTGTMTVNWNPSSCPNDVTAWPADAQDAFAHAVDIWESVIVSTVPIEVDACWRPLGTNVLGAAGATSIRRNFSGAPMANTWYPVAVANEFSQSDLNGNIAEITAHFSSQFSNWYFGTNGAPGPSQYDFVTVVVHEIAHGLGFAGSMSVTAGLGQYGHSGHPTFFDRYAENGAGASLIDGFPNGSVALANQLTSSNIRFDAVEVRNVNGGDPAELYAPPTWVQGTSFAHLDDVFDNSSNALMTHSISNGEAIHDPGTITLAMFAEMGWETSEYVAPTPTPTILTPEPSVTPTVPGIDDANPTQVYLPLIVR